MAAVVLLDGEGKRIVVRYFGSKFADAKEEMAFEKKLFDKTARTNARQRRAQGAPRALASYIDIFSTSLCSRCISPWSCALQKAAHRQSVDHCSWLPLAAARRTRLLRWRARW